MSQQTTKTELDPNSKHASGIVARARRQCVELLQGMRCRALILTEVSRRMYLRSASAVLGSLMCLAATHAHAYDVKEIGSFHIGGEEVVLSGLPERQLRFAANSPQMRVDPNGAFEVGQMYVQYVLLRSPKSPYPILMWHGGGLAGPTWETKPDGGEGWQNWFLRAGYDVYVSDAVERGRASWARYPEIYSVEPFFSDQIGSLGAVQVWSGWFIFEPTRSPQTVSEHCVSCRSDGSVREAAPSTLDDQRRTDPEGL